ncbi:MAG TPA: hypothetical protein VGK73_39965 [Polyangiaceae bacterium]
MRSAALSPFALAAALVACNVTEVPLPESSVAINQCESSDDCDGTRCENGACVASRTELTRLLVQVTPPTTLPVLGGLAFYTVLDRQSPSGGRLNIALDPVADVTGHVDLHPDDDCDPEPDAKGRTLAVDVSFSPSERVLGIASSVYVASVNPEADSDRYEFFAEIPPGNYDVYIKPRPTETCPKPPRLVLAQAVAGPLAVTLPVPKTLTVDVYWPAPLDEPLEPEPGDGWKVALLDEPTGRTLSTEPVLAPLGFDETKGAWHYQTQLSYSTMDPLGDDADQGGTDEERPLRPTVLRLTPPRSVERPTILSELFEGELTQKALLPPNVIVQGQTAILGRTVPVEASLKITARALQGFDSGILASYTRTVSVPKSGLFEVNLPPGTYTVQATPGGQSAACSEAGATETSPCLAAATTTWEVGAAPWVQAGRLLEFPEATRVHGKAILWSDRPPTGASVHMTPSPTAVPSNVIDASFGAAELSPRVAGGLVGEQGEFSFSADPGVFDLVVQPDPSTRLGWYVLAGVRLPELAAIGNITVQPPVVYTGSVSVGTGPEINIPNALIRAYVDVDGEPGGAVVQVAETWADEQARFSLLIPQQFGPEPSRRP